MKATGIIVEYNPLHNGHKFHITESRHITDCDVLIAVMSGNFVQRGEMAIVDKWRRAQAAIENGVDLVIELPYLCCTQSAQQFATSAVHLLNLAKVSSLVFGSESNDLPYLQDIASMSFKVDYLKEALHAGEGYAKAYGLGSAVMPANDILGVAYLKALATTAIKPYTIQRSTHYHDNKLNHGISSATAIRKAWFEGQDISADTALTISRPVAYWDQFYPILRVLFQTLDSKYIQDIFLFSEGIENHLIRQSALFDTWSEFLNHAVTKRYTKARIQRCCLHLLNQITKKEVTSLPKLNTLRILSFNSQGQKYLRFLQDEEVKIASRFADIPQQWRKMELKTTRLYTSLMEPKDREKLIKQEIGGALQIK